MADLSFSLAVGFGLPFGIAGMFLVACALLSDQLPNAVLLFSLANLQDPLRGLLRSCVGILDLGNGRKCTLI